MKKTRYILCLLAVVLISLGGILMAWAEEGTTDALAALPASSSRAAPLNGMCGTSLFYELNLDTGVMRIYGNGTMTNYNITTAPAPWSEYAKQITSIVLEGNVTLVGNYAFYGCKNLESISLNANLFAINFNAFEGCISLDQVEIDSLDHWMMLMFGSATANPCWSGADLLVGGEALSAVSVPEGQTMVGNYQFYGCTWLTELTLPEGITSIGNEAFRNCTGLANVVLPESLERVGGFSFTSCMKLEEITLGNQVKEVGESAFLGCTGLKTVTMGSALQTVGAKAFDGCAALEAVHGYDLAAWMGIAFSDRTSNPCSYAHHLYLEDELVTDLVVPAWAPSVGNYAFVGCSDIKTVAVTDGVHTLGTYAFADCTGMTEISLPDSVTSLGAYALSGCTSLRSIRLPASLTVTEPYLLAGCTSLETVIFPAGLKTISEATFLNCSSLETATFPTSLTVIGKDAFSGCTSLQKIKMPANLVTVGDGSFRNCVALKRMRFPDKLQRVGAEAFKGCESLEFLYLPATMSSVGLNAFADTALTTVVYDGTADKWSSVTVAEGNEALAANMLHHTEHIFDQQVVDPEFRAFDASCMLAASYYYSCLCGEKGTTAFYYGEALGHSGGEATCTALAVCEVCHLPYGTLLPHIPDRENATCLDAVTCTECHNELTAELGHDLVSSVTPPRCETGGYTTHVCSRCDYTVVDSETPATGHTPGAPATCEIAQFCVVCDKILEDAFGHSFEVERREPTCTMEGMVVYTCTVCGHSEKETLEAAGHTPGADATCEAPQLCEICFAILTPPLGHTYTATVTPPTCIAAGYTTHVCTVCNANYVDEPVAATGHNEGTPATCTSPGFCGICNAITSVALGHDYKATVTAPTCTAEGFTTHTCSKSDRSHVVL